MFIKDTSKLTPIRVTFFGDSICGGQGVSIHAGWVARLAQELDTVARAHGREIIVTNASSNGSTTRQALERMPYEVQSQGIDVFVVQFGLNDCNYWQTDAGLPRVSPDAFAANLKEIVQRGRKSGASSVFLNNNHPTTRDTEILPSTTITYQQSNRQYNQIIRDVVSDLSDSIVLNDIESIFLSHTENDRQRLQSLLLQDGLHLSLEGHNLYFHSIFDRVTTAIKECIVIDHK